MVAPESPKPDAHCYREKEMPEIRCPLNGYTLEWYRKATDQEIQTRLDTARQMIALRKLGYEVDRRSVSLELIEYNCICALNKEFDKLRGHDIK